MSLLSMLATPICTNAMECAGQGAGTFLGTPQRIWASVAALVALSAVIAGWSALRAGRRVSGGGRKGAIVALVVGSIGAVNLAVADGGLGTGNGVFGGAVALVLGLAGACLGGLALARSRRTEAGGRPQRTAT